MGPIGGGRPEPVKEGRRRTDHRGMRTWMPRAHGAVAAVLLIGLAGCGSESGGAGATDPVAPTPTKKPPLSTQVKEIAVNAWDVGDRASVVLLDDGDKVKGQITLDHCGYDFSATENHRVARWQVVIKDGKGRGIGSSEVVAYDSAGRAEKAMEQVRASVRRCPKGYVKSKVPGAPPMRYAQHKITKLADLPVSDNARITARLSVKASPERPYATSFFQRKGAILSGLYFVATKKPDKDDIAVMHRLAEATGKRLANS